ncbi:hypothetical protein JL09_g5968 [Pichia kudriavzevii]|uniref:Uncharacterized protein n=2 Tax=Pichia kudriavzevii TaxID=4909 RepID=A0A099NQ66_PICKU|nr:hypothetical protein JL09_g5968 [Pichia kudriavzevii]
MLGYKLCGGIQIKYNSLLNSIYDKGKGFLKETMKVELFVKIVGLGL